MFNDGFPCTHRVLDSGHCNGIISGSLNIVVQLTILLGQNSSIKFILPGVETDLSDKCLMIVDFSCPVLEQRKVL